MMKKVIFVLSLCFFSIFWVFPQIKVDTDCNSIMKNIFKVHYLKIRYEAVQSLYQKSGVKDSFIMTQYSSIYMNGPSGTGWNRYFVIINGLPMDDYKPPEPMVIRERRDFLYMSDKEKKRYWEQYKDSVSRIEPEHLEYTLEDMYKYFRQTNFTPEKALKEYRDFMDHILLEKEIYLKCIDSELAKGDSSEYAKEYIGPYSIWDVGPVSPRILTRLDYLKVFKEFVLIGNEPGLPHDLRVIAYLKCGCKIP